MNSSKEDYFAAIGTDEVNIPVNPKGRPEYRQEEREILKKQMEEWEAKNGKVVTSPITHYSKIPLERTSFHKNKILPK